MRLKNQEYRWQWRQLWSPLGAPHLRGGPGDPLYIQLRGQLWARVRTQLWTQLRTQKDEELS